MSRSKWDEDDEDDRYRPVYHGSRDYEGLSSSVGEALGDAFVAAKNATSTLVENVGRETSGVVEGIGRELNKHDVLRDLGGEGRPREGYGPPGVLVAFPLGPRLCRKGAAFGRGV